MPVCVVFGLAGEGVGGLITHRKQTPHHLMPLMSLARLFFKQIEKFADLWGRWQLHLKRLLLAGREKTEENPHGLIVFFAGLRASATLKKPGPRPIFGPPAWRACYRELIIVQLVAGIISSMKEGRRRCSPGTIKLGAVPQCG